MPKTELNYLYNKDLEISRNSDVIPNSRSHVQYEWIKIHGYLACLIKTHISQKRLYAHYHVIYDFYR